MVVAASSHHIGIVGDEAIETLRMIDGGRRV